MQFIAKWAWIGAIAFGAVLVVSGIYMIAEARAAHDEIRDTLAEERSITVGRVDPNGCGGHGG